MSNVINLYTKEPYQEPPHICDGCEARIVGKQWLDRIIQDASKAQVARDMTLFERIFCWKAFWELK